MKLRLTNMGPAEEAAMLRRARRRRRVLDLRRGRRPRLAHGICAVHGDVELRWLVLLVVDCLEAG